MKIILIGAPGCGKGTVASRLSQELSIPHISVGEIFREHMEKQTEIGRKIEDVMHSGHLVPDEITIQCVSERIHKDDCKNGFILDGFPRTLNQAKLFKNICNVENILEINVSASEVKKRLALRKRSDDTEEIIDERLKIFEKEIVLIRNFYKDDLITINGNQPREVVYNAIKEQVLRGSLK